MDHRVLLISLVCISLLGCVRHDRAESATSRSLSDSQMIQLAKEFYVPRVGRDFDVHCRSYHDLSEFDQVNPDCCRVRRTQAAMSQFDPGALPREGPDAPVVLIGFRCDASDDPSFAIEYMVAEVQFNERGRIADVTASIMPLPSEGD